MTVALDKFYKI